MSDRKPYPDDLTRSKKKKEERKKEKGRRARFIGSVDDLKHHVDTERPEKSAPGVRYACAA